MTDNYLLGWDWLALNAQHDAATLSRAVRELRELGDVNPNAFRYLEETAANRYADARAYRDKARAVEAADRETADYIESLR